jgi:hypothetical protein
MSINDTDKDLPEHQTADDELEIVLTGEDGPEWMGTQDIGSPAELFRKDKEDERAAAAGEVEEPVKTEAPDYEARIAEAARLAREETERVYRANEDRLEQQMLAQEKRSASVQRDAIKAQIDSLDLRIDQATSALGAAKAEGDAAEEVKIGRILRDLERARDHYADAQSKVPSDAVLDHQFQEYRRTKKPIAPASDTRGSDGMEPLNPTAKKWADNNGWYRDPKYEAEASYMMAVSNRLAREGKNPNSREYMDALTKEMHKAFPSLPVKDLDGRAMSAPARGQGGMPVASARSAAGGISMKNGKIRAELTASDRAVMRALKLDPNDKKAQQYFVREKIQTAQNERARRGYN